MIKIKGLKQAIGDYNRANAEGYYSPSYGYLMFDPSTGEIWCDYFYSLGHNSWKEYHDPAIIDLGRAMRDRDPDCKISMATVKAFIAANY